MILRFFFAQRLRSNIKNLASSYEIYGALIPQYIQLEVR